MVSRNKSLVALIKTHKYKYIVLGGAWQAEEYRGYLKSIDESIELIIDNGSIPIVIENSPYIPSSVSNLCQITTPKLMRMFYPHYCQIPILDVNEKQAPFTKIINSIKQKYKELVLIDPKKAICDVHYCNTEIDGIPIFADNHHMNYKGSELLGELYLKKYGNPLKPVLEAN